MLEEMKKLIEERMGFLIEQIIKEDPLYFRLQDGVPGGDQQEQAQKQVYWYSVDHSLPAKGQQVFVLAEGSTQHYHDPLAKKRMLFPYLAYFYPESGWEIVAPNPQRLPVKFWSSIPMPSLEDPKE